MNCFDLVVFKGGVISSLIILVQSIFYKKPKYGRWSHVGLILTSDFLDLLKIEYPKDEKYFVLESTLSGVLNDNVNDINDKVKFGIQIRSFNKLIQSYNYNKNKIAIVSLNNDIKINSITVSQIEDVLKFYEKYKDSKYDYTFYIFLKALFNCPSCINKFVNHSNLFFCSELVVEIYKILNIIDNKIDAETICPFELLKFDIYKELIELNNNNNIFII